MKRPHSSGETAEKQITALAAKGVRIERPESVSIGLEVDPGRISGEGVVIHAGSRISGAETFIGPGCRIGAEGPATLEDCRRGPRVALKGGYFQRSVFLEGAACGSGAHVREATILEEQASIAHTVGLKHTILFPFVTLGSLINFCDCLMAGGTSRRNHSEVGSAYIHFNFTPHQDKATASLIGEVPHGVMLDQKPIFLGGQGGMIGPCRLAYGVTVAAGTIVRRDELRSDRLLFGGPGREGNTRFVAGRYTGVKRIVLNNVLYLGNLAALEQWYRHVRRLFVGEGLPEPVWQGLCANVRRAIEERLERLRFFCERHAAAEGLPAVDAWWPQWAGFFETPADDAVPAGSRDEFLKIIQKVVGKHGRHYIKAVQALAPSERAAGTRWLQSVVDACHRAAAEHMPYLD